PAPTDQVLSHANAGCVLFAFGHEGQVQMLGLACLAGRDEAAGKLDAGCQRKGSLRLKLESLFHQEVTLREYSCHPLSGMRGERLLAMLLLLQANRRLTAAELADRLEVSVRTI